MTLAGRKVTPSMTGGHVLQLLAVHFHGVVGEVDVDAVVVQGEIALVLLGVPVGEAVVGLGHDPHGQQVDAVLGGVDAGEIQLLAVDGDGGGVAGVGQGGGDGDDIHHILSQGGGGDGGGQGEGQGRGTNAFHHKYSAPFVVLIHAFGGMRSSLTKGREKSSQRK